MGKICGECTACCLAMRVPDLDKPYGKWCKYCDRGVGCKIYADRPQNCRDFECAWFQSNASDIFRPDKCGVIFERIDEEVMWGSLLPGIRINKLILSQVNSFRSEGFSVIIHTDDGKTKDRLFISDKHEPEDVAKRVPGWLHTEPI